MKTSYLRRCIKDFVSGQGGYYFWGIFFLVITVAITTIIPLAIRDAVSILNSQSANNFLVVDERNDLIRAAVIVMILGFTLVLFRTLSRVLLFIPGRHIEEKVRQRYYEAIAFAPPGTLSEYKVGDLISRGTSDTTHIRVFLSMGVLHSVNTTLMLGFSLYLMLSINWKLTLICFLPAPVIHLMVRYISKKMWKVNEKAATQIGILSEKVRETISVHTLISIYPIFTEIIKRFTKENKRFLSIGEKLVRVRVSMSAVLQVLSGIAQLLLLWVGGNFVLTSEGGMRIEDFVAMGMYLAVLQEPLMVTGWMVTLFQRGKASLERLYNVIDIVDKNREEQVQKRYQDAQSLRHIDSDVIISVQNLVYKYKETSSSPENNSGNTFLLSIPALNLCKGKSYGLFGKIGSGKTTLVNILSGNISVPRGKCFYRGIDYCDISIDLLLGKFSIAPQESRHFSKSIMENIEQVMFNKSHPLIITDSSNKRCSFETAVKISQIEGDIKCLPNSWESLLGEYGINLSGGQKQRLSILRSLVKPHEVLILDDVLSSVDLDTEYRILQHLYASQTIDECMIFISHRISSLTRCDEILIIENGRIKARGTHFELVASHVGYRKIYETQTLEKRIEEKRNMF